MTEGMHTRLTRRCCAPALLAILLATMGAAADGDDEAPQALKDALAKLTPVLKTASDAVAAAKKDGLSDNAGKATESCTKLGKLSAVTDDALTALDDFLANVKKLPKLDGIATAASDLDNARKALDTPTSDLATQWAAFEKTWTPATTGEQKDLWKKTYYAPLTEAQGLQKSMPDLSKALSDAKRALETDSYGWARKRADEFKKQAAELQTALANEQPKEPDDYLQFPANVETLTQLAKLAPGMRDKWKAVGEALAALGVKTDASAISGAFDTAVTSTAKALAALEKCADKFATYCGTQAQNDLELRNKLVVHQVSLPIFDLT